jgi:uncharacterized membrane protein
MTKTRQLTLAAAIGALYAALTMGASVFGIAYGPVQFRFSEALCVLPFFFPASAWGLFLGCLLANLLSPYGPLDVVFGSLATLLAALLTARMPGRWLAPLPPVVCNGLIVGALLSFAETGSAKGFLAAFAFNGLTVAAGELVVCFGLGIPLLVLLPRLPFFRDLIVQNQRYISGSK